MAQEYFEIVFRLVAALAAGGLIGLERSHRGRPAGFRTHALVCLASSLLMLVTVYESHWCRATPAARVVLDPTRMAQGIMTGIGFVGAGAIIKEGLTVRGLTTAASIWITAAIGILTGVGFYFAAVIGTVLTLGTLSAFRWIEAPPADRVLRRLHGALRARSGDVARRRCAQLVAEHGLDAAQPQLPAARRGRAVRVPDGAAHAQAREPAQAVRDTLSSNRGRARVPHRARERISRAC